MATLCSRLPPAFQRDRERISVALRKGTGLVLAIIVIAVLISTAAVAFLVALPAGTVVAEESVLVITLTDELSEVPPQSLFGSFLSAPPTIRAIADAIRRAQHDTRIKGLILKPTLTAPSWAKLQEIRDAIKAFGDSGKTTVAYLEFGGQEDYYVSTSCQQIYLLPTSPLDLRGIATYELFLREALDKIGTFPDFLHVGDYKTAVNLYTEKTMTPPQREMSESLNGDSFQQLVDAVATARKLDADRVKALVDEGPFLPHEAVEATLVDDLAYDDELFDRADLPTEAEEIDLDDYLRSGTTNWPARRDTKIGLIYAVGEIVSGESTDGASGPVAGSNTLVNAIRDAEEDESVKAVVLRVDSPGGSSVASDVIWRELMLLREIKPLVVSMSDLAASGGYYISMPGHAIVAQPGTLTGSIGVFTGKYVVSGTLDKLGIGAEWTTSGQNATATSPFSAFTPRERDEIQGQIQAFYEQFVEKVADARQSTPENVHEVAQGRVWTGRQAKEIGLVDELGGLDVAVRLAKARAQLPVDADVPVVVFAGHRDFSSIFDTSSWPGLRASLRESLLSSLLGPEERRALARLAPAGRMLRRREPLALMPYVYSR